MQLSNTDKDHRYMATSDLLAALQQPDWRQPSNGDDCAQLCAKVVNQLDDASGDISALAVKWYVHYTRSGRAERCPTAAPC